METYLTGVSEYVLDVETTGLDVYNDILVGICLYNPDLPSFYVPFNHTDLHNKRVEGQMTEEECKAVMLPYLANGSLKCINHNIKFDDKVVTFQWGQRIANVWWDTNIAGWVLNENEKHRLKPIAKMEESRSSEELMGYSITTVDNKEYYSPDVKAIQALLIPLVVMDPEGDIVEELKKLDMRRNVMVEC